MIKGEDNRDRLKRLIEVEGEIGDFEFQVYRRNGTIFWISKWACAIQDAQGRSLYHEGSCVEIT